MFSNTRELHRLYLDLEKARDEQKLAHEDYLRSGAERRLSLAQTGINGIDEFLKGIKK